MVLSGRIFWQVRRGSSVAFFYAGIRNNRKKYGIPAETASVRSEKCFAAETGLAEERERDNEDKRNCDWLYQHSAGDTV